MPDIDIVIVNFMSAAHTINCVGAAFQVAADDGVRVQIIVINNGDDNVDFEGNIRSAGNVIVQNNPANIGFGAACNQGAACGASDIILFLNPDATLKPAALETCLEAFKNPKNEHLGAIGPEITDESGNLVRSCSRLPTRRDLLLRTVGAHAAFQNTGYPFLPLAAHEKSGEVDQVMGAALFIRRSLFQSLSGFDNRFFLYYDDVDLCARIRATGTTCYYLKESRVNHIGRASSSRDPGMALALHIRSRLTYARVHFGSISQALLLISSFSIELPIRFFQALLGGGVVDRQGVLRAYQLLLNNTLPGAPPNNDKT
jgi:N-acetylglucosaminyl-diphospho-decaprenol L-rhamnosyltransferase